MLKALSNSRISLRFCRCQLLSTKFIKSTKSRIYYPIHSIKNEFHHPNYGYRSVFSVNALPRFYCTTVDLDDNGNESEGLEEMLGLDESHEYLENGFIQIKELLYSHLSSDDEFLVEINNCNNEDEVSISLDLLSAQRNYCRFILRKLLRIITNNSDKIAQHHAVLSIVKLWNCKHSKFKVPRS